MDRGNCKFMVLVRSCIWKEKVFVSVFRVEVIFFVGEEGRPNREIGRSILREGGIPLSRLVMYSNRTFIIIKLT